MTFAASVAVAQDPVAPQPRAGVALAPVKAGSTGPTVVALQRALGLAADGAFGPATERAVRRYQRRHGLEVDGVAGPATLRALGIARFAAAPAKPRARSQAPSSSTTATLERIARCESGRDPTAVSPTGEYRGKYQFSRSTWRALGGRGDPAKASESTQDRIAEKLLRLRGTSPWPACG